MTGICNSACLNTFDIVIHAIDQKWQAIQEFHHRRFCFSSSTGGNKKNGYGESSEPIDPKTM
jgi:hypothetical protein